VIELEAPSPGHGEDGGIADAQAIDGDWRAAGDGNGGREGRRGKGEHEGDKKASRHTNLCFRIRLR
jgi:hypothetical protein